VYLACIGLARPVAGGSSPDLIAHTRSSACCKVRSAAEPCGYARRIRGGGLRVESTRAPLLSTRVGGERSCMLARHPVTLAHVLQGSGFELSSAGWRST
jgi:hypothetical protein